MADLSDTIAPNSDQLDAVDLITGSRIFTITRVRITASDQPVNIDLAEFPRVWRPGLSMRRVLVALWGADGDVYVGRRLELFCDPTVEFGGQAVGGIRIARMSHIDGVKKVPLIVSRKKSATYTVKPLPDDEPSAPTEQPTLPDRIEAAVAAYAEAGVTVPMLEAKVALPRDEWAEQTVADLGDLFARLKARETTKDAEFDTTGDES